MNRACERYFQEDICEPDNTTVRQAYYAGFHRAFTEALSVAIKNNEKIDKMLVELEQHRQSIPTNYRSLYDKINDTPPIIISELLRRLK